MIALIPQFNFVTMEKSELTMRGIRREFAEGWLRVSRDSTAFLGLVLLVVTSTSTLVIATLLPKFSTNVLGVAPENIVFVLAPVVIGVFLGLRSVEFIADRSNKLITISVAFVFMAGSLIALGFVAQGAEVVRSADPVGLFNDEIAGDRGARILATILLANVYCFSLTVVMTMGRALLNERIPLRMQGRVFAAQAVLANLTAILPVLVAGVLADMVGVAPVLVGAGVLALLAALWSEARGSRAVAAEPAAGQ
jgi:hypothetical protein